MHSLVALFPLLVQVALLHRAGGNEDAKRLHDDLLMGYNRHRRPASHPNEAVRVKLKLRLSQIIDLHEIDQIMTCSVWMKQEWMDRKLQWDPERYGGVKVLYVPYELIWVPDIVLFNTVHIFNITISTKATLHHSGLVSWEPPAIFRSFCQIDVRWFPFDEQSCALKFGSWSYPGNLLDLELLDEGEIHALSAIPDDRNGSLQTTVAGIDLSDYYPSVEWDIMSRVATKYASTHKEPGTGREQRVVFMSFLLILRRKPLFYTVNLVFPCVGISFLTILVFYLPSESGEKIALCISILVALTVFFLLLTEIIPATSISLPLIGKYLLFTMVMVTLSVLITVISLNFHFRKPTTHTLGDGFRIVFLKWLPKLLFMRRPMTAEEMRGEARRASMSVHERNRLNPNYHEHRMSRELGRLLATGPADERLRKLYYSPSVVKAFENVCFIAELLKKKDRDNKIDEDWKYIAMVLDRLFLVIFATVCFFGTALILLQAPTLYDGKRAIELHPSLNLSST